MSLPVKAGARLFINIKYARNADSAVGPKSYILGRDNSPILRANNERQKSYEAARFSIRILQTITWERDCRVMRHRHTDVRSVVGSGPAGGVAANDNHHPNHARGSEDSKRSVGFTRCADRSLSRSASGSEPGRLDLSAGSHSTAAVDDEEQEFEGQDSGRCRGKTELGPKCPGDGGVS